MIKAVVFDLDGTLIDSTDAIVASNLYVFDHLGLPRPTRDAIVAAIGLPLDAQFRDRLDGDIEHAMRVYRRHYAETACASTTLQPGAREMLDAFAEAGLKMGFATSKKLDASELVLGHLGVLDYFNARIGPDEVVHPKPAPDALHAAMRILDVAPEEFVFVGDMHFDVVAAQRAGVACLAVTTGYQTRAELEALGPDAVFDGLDEVQDWVLRRLDLRLAATDA